ncbi:MULTISPECIES: hypothetical protein [unclassified Rathayibacter]|uniref:hypothetical protein n=1 Tax=unclassified Rathayibacter TaxID=2609250 RepID=UPI001049EFEF|nr:MULTISPECIES: hypothetical protein [unclassified Rathayibacter]TCL86049.1 hypothetical protein EDF49_101718 [Rathayibacter sp. PhB192]TCM31870.1 hypothetical protein EDF43_101718 [Rathayibacter sp. PhB179]
MEQTPSPDRPVDPHRAQLDARWADYLRTRAQADDHSDWLLEAMGGYRDEIVHFGGQLLNDVAIREWDEARARRAYDRYRAAADDYDQNPAAWEAEFWRRIRERSEEAERERRRAEK